MGGGDKPLLDVGGPMLLERSSLGWTPADRHQRQWRPARFAAFGLPVLPDGAFAGQGRWRALAGLDWAAALAPMPC